MVAYTSGDYVYFNSIKDKPQRRHIGFILSQRHDMYITQPLKIMEGTFVSFPKQIVKNDLTMDEL